MKKLLPITVLLFTLLACSEKEDPLPMPEALFTADKESIEKGGTIVFTNNSLNATRYEWDFGNGQSSIIKNPTMKFDQAGEYTVTLSAYNQEDQVHTSSKIITVKAKPAAGAFFSIKNAWDSLLVESGKNIEFFNQSVNAVRYEWNFGNGKTSTSENPKIIFDQAGVYTVTLSAYNEEDVASNYSVELTIGERYLLGFHIHQISFLDQNGQVWDTSDEGPDPIFGIVISGSQTFDYETDIKYNINQSQLPISLIPIQKNIKLTDTDWGFALYDFDDDFNGPDLMGTWQFNPKELGVNGAIRMNGGGYEIDLIYEIR